MVQSNQIAGLTGTEVKRRLETSLRRHGWGDRLRKAADVADQIGLPRRRLYSYTDPGGTLPTLPDFLKLAGVLPEGFANDMLDLVGVGGAYRVASHNAPVSPAHTMTVLAERMAMLARHMEDGQQTHSEALEALPEMIALHADVGRYIQALRGQVGAL